MAAARLMGLCFTMVRPHVEYANSIWSPYKKGDIEAIEKVQKSYKISDITQKVTIQRTFITIKFTYFEIQTIRGLRGEMIEVYKIIHMYDRSVALELPRNVPSNKYNK